MSSEYPILYSFRRCPYAMRARMALLYSGQVVQLREIVLRNKPPEMLAVSPKGTVPVLQLSDTCVIDESRDVMLWALQQHDPDTWLQGRSEAQQQRIHDYIDRCDNDFKPWLDRYKYADRHPEHPAEYYRQQAELFLAELDLVLSAQADLMDDKVCLADVALFPFVRQFAHVDRDWFYQTPYVHLQRWLDDLLGSALFSGVMHKYGPWHSSDAPRLFPLLADKR